MPRCAVRPLPWVTLPQRLPHWRLWASNSRSVGELVSPAPLPLLAAAAGQIALGLVRRNAWYCALGGVGFAAAVAMALPSELGHLRGSVAFHGAVIALLIVGAAFKNQAGVILSIAAQA